MGRCLNHIQIIDPNGKIYVAWMCIVTLTLLYNAWVRPAFKAWKILIPDTKQVIPLRSTFPYQTPQNRPYWMAFDYLSDAIYVIDMMLIQPRVKYLQEGFWVTERMLLTQNYIKNKHFKAIEITVPVTAYYILG